MPAISDEARERDPTGRPRPELLLAAIDAAADAIILTNLDSEIIHWNPAAERLTGWTAAEVLGTPGRRFVERSQRIEVARLLRDVAAGLTVRIPETELERRDGTTVPVELSVGPIADQDGAPFGVVSIVRDISEQRAATKALADANDRLAALAERLSHDLRRPLTVVAGFLDLLVGRKAEQLDDEGRDWLQRCATHKAVLIDVVNGLVSFSTEAHGEMEPIDLRAVIDLTVDSIRDELPEVDVTIGPLPTVLGDRQLLSRVFDNLLANAVRFRRDDRGLSISITATPLSERTVDVTIADNGLGLEPDELDSIFEHGRRGRAGTDRPGSGIGLATVRTLCDFMGGDIRAERTPDGGAAFHLQLRQS